MNDYDRARLLEAEWQMDNPELGTGSAYLAEISIYCSNRTGLLADVSRTFSERKISIVNVMTRNSVKQGTANIDISFEVHSRDELDELIRIIMNIPSVLDITRKTG
jgi:GTP pyrophosphokinase